MNIIALTDCGNFTLYSADHFGFHRFEHWDHVIQTNMWSWKTPTVQQTKQAIQCIYINQAAKNINQGLYYKLHSFFIFFFI